MCILLTKLVEENRSNRKQKLYSVLWAYCCAYKTLMNTPFNFVYGLDVVLHNEFSMPTLKATQQLEKINHELSNKNDKLEK